MFDEDFLEDDFYAELRESIIEDDRVADINLQRQVNGLPPLGHDS